jgi:multifunctional methyltransferase subunit TRM112
MRLFQHNLLACVKCQSFPLAIEAKTIAPAATDFDAQWTRRMLARVDYAILRGGLEQLKEQHPQVLGSMVSLPESMDDLDVSSDESPHLRAVHAALASVAVQDGTLTCGHCGLKYEVKDFIPVMLVKA